MSTALHQSNPSHHKAALRLARLACEALIAEAELTPKPGLVDRRGPGSHADLSLHLMRLSAHTLEPFFYEIALTSSTLQPTQLLRAKLGKIGRRAEASMLKATNGSNTHRGAIWNLGLFTSAASLVPITSASTIAGLAQQLALIPDHQIHEASHGDLVSARYNVTGARGEAQSGFPHILNSALPTLRKQRLAGIPESAVRIDALLSIMATLQDTCILYRRGPSALQAVQQLSQSLLTAGGCSTLEGQHQLRQLDQLATNLHISPGGAADLLACTLFLDALDRGADSIAPDTSDPTGGLHGAA